MSRRAEGARIYNLFPTLLGPVERWPDSVPRIAAMGFDWVFVNPFHYPGHSGSLYAVSDHYRLHPALEGSGTEPADTLLERFVNAAERAGLSVMMDLVVNHTAKDAPLVTAHPDWYRRDESGEVASPFAANPDDPDDVTVWGDLAELDYTPRPGRDRMLAYWDEVVRHYVSLGFKGFRCDAAYKLPGDVWGELIRTARASDPDIAFFAETLGAQLHEVDQLAPAGFDCFFNSARWWDFRADWLLDQYEQFRHLAPSVAFPESHDTERLAALSGGSERESRFWYLFTALFAAAVMIPIGYEYGFRRPLHVVETRPEDWETPVFDIGDFIAAVNGLKARTPVLCEEGPQQRFTAADAPLVGLLRRSERTPARAAVLVNPDTDQVHTLDAGNLTRALQRDPRGFREATPGAAGPAPGSDEAVRVPPRSIRVFLTSDPRSEP